VRRVAIDKRPDWEQRAEESGFIFHHVGGEVYWDESVCYAFTLEEIENDIEDPTQELADMCLDLVSEVAANDELLRKLAIPEAAWQLVLDSWKKGEHSLYGRFDFAYDGAGPAKLYEYNADTPTALYEAAYFQWLWMEEARTLGLIPESADQFNTIQEALISTFKIMPEAEFMHFACVLDSHEDLATVHYLRDCAEQAGIRTGQMYIEDIGVDSNGQFVDQHDQPIRWLFKLYPWEFMVRDQYADNLAHCDTTFLEPPWKMLLSNKGILPLLWERHPQHPNLLASWFHDPYGPPPLRDYVIKPLFSREGANVRVFRDRKEVLSTPGQYGLEGCIVQALCPPPHLDGHGPVIGSWVVGGRACGMGIREDDTPITGDLSRFVPHVIAG
jgi:glutathionylspermidine synthase